MDRRDSTLLAPARAAVGAQANPAVGAGGVPELRVLAHRRFNDRCLGDELVHIDIIVRTLFACLALRSFLSFQLLALAFGLLSLTFCE
jgi:hypothetical protein